MLYGNNDNTDDSGVPRDPVQSRIFPSGSAGRAKLRSRTTNTRQPTPSSTQRHTLRTQPERALIARENRRRESLVLRINYHGGGTSHALYRFEPFPHFSRMASLFVPLGPTLFPFRSAFCNFSLPVKLCCTVVYSRAAYLFPLIFFLLPLVTFYSSFRFVPPPGVTNPEPWSI